MAQSSFTTTSLPPLPKQERRYLKPSIFWSIRQGFPRWLSMAIVAISLAIPLIAWAIVSYAGWVTPMFLPTPTAVLQSGLEMFREDDLWVDVWASCARVAGGFLVAAHQS